MNYPLDDKNKNPRYAPEILKLIIGLEERNIPYSVRGLFDGYQVFCPGWDAICHCGSYGHERGLLETMGLQMPSQTDEEFDKDDVVGYLTADKILEAIDAQNRE